MGPELSHIAGLTKKMATSLVCLVVLCAMYSVANCGISDGNHELPPAIVPAFDSILEDTDSEMTIRLATLESEMANNDEITKDILRRLAALESRQDEEDEVRVDMARETAVLKEPDTEHAERGAAVTELPRKEESLRESQVAQTTPEMKSNQRDEEDEVRVDMERETAVLKEPDTEHAQRGAAVTELPQKEEPLKESQVAQTTPEMKSNQRDAEREVTEMSSKKKISGQKAKPGEQRPRNACGTPQPREGTTVTLMRGVAVYSCKPHHRNIGGRKNRSKCGMFSGLWSPVDIFCSNFTTCSMVINGRSVYNGTVSTTKSGYKCQRWDKQDPNKHWFMSDQSFQTTTGTGPETRSGASNYCRDPGVMVADKKLWCYTTHPGVRSEPCNIPTCKVPKESVKSPFKPRVPAY